MKLPLAGHNPMEAAMRKPAHRAGLQARTKRDRIAAALASALRQSRPSRNKRPIR